MVRTQQARCSPGKQTANSNTKRHGLLWALVRTSSRRSVSDALPTSEATAARRCMLALVSSTTQTCCTLYSVRVPPTCPQQRPEAHDWRLPASRSWRGNQLPLHPPGTLNYVCVPPALLFWGGAWPVGCLLVPFFFFSIYCLARATAAGAASWSVATRAEWPITMLDVAPGRAVPGRSKLLVVALVLDWTPREPRWPPSRVPCGRRRCGADAHGTVRR
jgi:hypothetical protein